MTYNDGSGWKAPVAGHTDIKATSLTFGADNAKTIVVGVRAGNAHGWSGWVNSAPAGPYTPQPPAAVGSVDLTRGDGTLTASWEAAGGATSYHVTYSDDHGQNWSLAALHHASTSIDISVSNSETYIVGVRARNADGGSGWTNSAASGPWAPPTPPTVTATRGDDGDSASVSWTAYAGDDFSYYRVIVCTDAQYDGSSCSGTVHKSAPVYDAASTGPVSITGLEAQTGYGVILQTWRTDGALKSHAAIPALPAPPAAPSNLAVTPDDDGDLTVSWDAVSGATGYDVESNVNLTGGGWQTAHSNTSSTSVTVTDDANNRIERVRVRARNAGGAGPWAELSRAPSNDWLNVVIQGGGSAQGAQGQSQLAAPATITVTRDNWIRDEKLHVSWAAVSGASGYNLACSDSGWDAPGGSSWWNCGSTTSATSLTVDNHPLGDLSSSRSYLVAVRAVTGNAADASDWKRSEDVRPVFGHLFDLTHSRSGGSVTLSWTPNFWTTGYEVDCAVQGQTYTRCATLTGQDDTAATHSVTLTSWTVGGTDYAIDDGQAYNIRITSTNKWGSSGFSMDAPLIAAFPNVSNLSATSDTFGQNVSSAQSAAVGFTTGSNSGGYTLEGVTIKFITPTHGRTFNGDIVAAIHAALSGDPASATTHTLTLVHGDPKTGGNATYSCSGTCSLSANTTYFLVLKTSSTANYVWDTTDSDDETNSTNFGWTIANGLKQEVGGSWSDRTWTGIFRVSATPDPSLAASNVATTTATLTIGGYSGNWYYKHTNTGATCEGPMSGTTKALTGLDAGTSYTYSAYSDSTCTTGNKLATATAFTTLSPTLTASGVGATTATLTIANHTGNWYYKHTNTGATCDGPVATTTKDLTGLDAGTDYTYSAYSDSTCTTGNLLATASQFTTPVTVSNLSATHYTTGEVGNYFGTQQQGAQAFTTGSNAGGYTLSSIDIQIAAKAGSPTNLQVTLHAASGSNPNTGTTLATLSSASSPSSAGTYPYTCSGSGCALSASTTYFVLLAAPSSASGSYYTVSVTNATSETKQPSGNGWSIADGGRIDFGGTWSTAGGPLRIKVSAAPDPSLTANNVASTTATLTLTRHPGDWYYKHTNTGATCDGPVSGTRKNLAGLTGGTSYTYSAYSDSACTTGNLIATAAAFTTPTSLTASGVTASAATLTIGGHTGGWWHQGGKVGGTLGSCTSVPSGNTASLSGLDSNTAYEYKAYSKANCVTADLIATERFRTSTASSGPAFTANSVTWNTARLTLSGHTGNWWHKGGNRAGSESDCTAGASNFILDLADLSGNTEYTYTAYSDSGCATQLARITFRTQAGPELAASSVTASSATLTLSNHKGDWWYNGGSSRSPGACLQGDADYSVDLTGLTAGTKHNYTAYSDNACKRVNRLDTVQFTTLDPSLTVSNVGTTTARITVAGHTGQWWYQADTGPHNTCQGPVAAGTAYKDLTGLTAGAFYVYSAYSASGCADTVKLASAEVATAVTASNLGQSTTDTLHPIDAYGQGFTTGNADATLLSATVQFGDVFGSVNATVSLRAAQSNGKPATTNRATLSGTPVKGQQSTFTCADGGSNDCSLDANTKYFIYVSGSSGYLASTASNTETLQPAGNGWSIEDAMRRQTSFDLLGSGYAMKIEVEAIPHEELTASSVTATGATLTLKRHIGDWYYKSTTTGQTTCTSAGSATSVTLTLTAGTSYTYSAYSDSTCTTGNLLATAAFTTQVSVSNLSETASGNNPRNINWIGGGSLRGNVANSFRTGSNSGGYTLESVTVKFAATNGSPGALTVAIHDHGSISQGPSGNTAVATLSGSNPSTAGDYTFTCSGSCTLSASTTYWVVMYSASGGTNSNYYSLTWTASNNQTSDPSSEAWQIGDTAKRGSGSSINTVSWNNVSPAEAVMFKVTATPN